MINFEKVTAIIVAAGSSSRMAGIDKCLINLLGKPLISYTISAFENNDLIDEIVIVTKSSSIETINEIIFDYSFKKVSYVVCGGYTRQQSVNNGINAACKDTKYLCIHDGARPLITESVISAAINSCVNYKAVTVAVPSKDTVKIVRDNYVISTPERSTLYNIQTPQVFCKEILLECIKNSNQEYTDDCQLLEAMGKAVYIEKGEYSNIKITTPEDLIIAEALLSRGECK